MILCPNKGMSDVDGTVVGLQGNPVSATPPNDEEVLTWVASAGEWQPKEVQVMEPWVGTVNTQRQIVQRIPWTCQTTGSAPASTGIVVTLPTDSSLALFVYGNFRLASSVAGSSVLGCPLTIANAGGTLTAAPSISSSLASNSGPFPSYATFLLSTSGTTVTLEVVFYTASSGITIDCQGFVDLILN